ncbi:MAG: LytR C-terminal domain-containing protein [Candidatus Neomarinimicrobiota bacterium]|nr:LytR C-terminal domain-containing protein [Candidatus Neomarinimicrobiota bacterium]
MIKRKRRKKKKFSLSNFNPPNVIILCLSLIIGLALYSLIDHFFYSNNKIKFNHNIDIVSLMTKSEYETKYGNKITIQLLNGNGVKGLAENYSMYLIQEGHDVISKQNARHHNYKESELILHNSNRKAAEDIANLIGISKKKIIIDPDPNLQCDVTLILGNDYKNLYSHKKMLSSLPHFELSK